ncbi:DNA/RNA polymerase [Phytophthora megakarya]|uniref:DNA/RNA polymerase n=1 Tax=Phytophthora megakarya TaxID=4795 RepID=A0A225VWU4_9STRA|nr:DNA/RNA polymerase [Phytophthora megakarya]
MVQAGIIRPSTSAFCAPMFCVKEPVCNYLPVIPMSRMKDMIDEMGGSYSFSHMDLLWGYYQVKLHESDIPFTAFRCPMYLVTPMGLSGSPGTFNRLLQRVFCDYVMRVYFDGIYVYTQDQNAQKHVNVLDRVLMRCQEQQLYVKLSKCQFGVEEIRCLGDFVGRNGVHMGSDKCMSQDFALILHRLQARCMRVLRVYARKKPCT